MPAAAAGIVSIVMPEGIAGFALRDQAQRLKTHYSRIQQRKPILQQVHSAWELQRKVPGVKG